MKQIVLSVLCLFLGVSLGFAQAKPNVSVDKSIHDFGKVNEEVGNVSCEFVIKNTGDAPLVISRVTASCGCTTPDWTKSPIAPGATGIVKATYGAKGRPGPFSKTISVYTNAQTSTHILTIKGDVIPRSQTPEAAYPIAMGYLRLKKTASVFNMVKKTETRTDIVEVYNSGKTALNVSFSNLPAYITATCAPASVAPGQTGVITLNYDGKKVPDYGTYTDRVNVLINSKSAANQYIQVRSTVTEDFSGMTAVERENAPVLTIEPVTLNFNDLPKTKELDLKVTNTGKSNLKIHNIQSTSLDMLSVASGKKEIKPGKSQVFKVTVHPEKVTQNTSVYLNIASNDPRSSLKSVRAVISPSK